MKILSKLVASTFVLAFASSQSLAADIVDTAAGDKNFSTIVAAVKAAGLVDTLKGDGPFTELCPKVGDGVVRRRFEVA